MHQDDFSNDAPGQFVKNLDGRDTFLPNPLPGPLRLDLELVTVLNEAERGLGRVTGLARTLPNPGLVTRAFVRREAQISSRIEGIITSYESLALAHVAPPAVDEDSPVAEVRNNEEAIDFMLQATQRDGREISVTLLRQMHAVLLRGARDEGHRPGQFRDRQVYIGSSDNIDDAALVPPPAHLVRDAMESLSTFITSPSDLPPLVRNAMVHYQFEAIHPFADGNGRTGRALILLLMCYDGLLPQPTLNPSLHMERNRPEYYRRLREVSTRNKWSAWIKFFARSIAEAATDAVRRIEAIRTLQAKYHDQLRQRGRSALLLNLVDALFVEQATTIPMAAVQMGDVKYDTAARHVSTLVEAGILTEVTGKERDRIYVAREIIATIQDRPKSAIARDVIRGIR